MESHKSKLMEQQSTSSNASSNSSSNNNSRSNNSKPAPLRPHHTTTETYLSIWNGSAPAPMSILQTSA